VSWNVVASMIVVVERFIAMAIVKKIKGIFAKHHSQIGCCFHCRHNQPNLALANEPFKVDPPPKFNQVRNPFPLSLSLFAHPSSNDNFGYQPHHLHTLFLIGILTLLSLK